MGYFQLIHAHRRMILMGVMFFMPLSVSWFRQLQASWSAATFLERHTIHHRDKFGRGVGGEGKYGVEVIVRE